MLLNKSQFKHTFTNRLYFNRQFLNGYTIDSIKGISILLELYALKITEDVSQYEYEKLLKLVSTQKRERIKRYRFFDDAKRSLYADLLIRYLICEQLKVKNSRLKFEQNNYGKPLLVEPCGIHFNISHAGDWVVAVTDDNPIGIDIEKIGCADYTIAEKFFSKKEYIDLMSKDDDEKNDYFYILWTLKESYIKALGQGLSIPLNAFSFSVINEEIKLIHKGVNNNFSFFKHKIDEKHILSVCCQHQSSIFSVNCLSIHDLRNYLLGDGVTDNNIRI